jgi:release factor glutamine methyltransferase
LAEARSALQAATEALGAVGIDTPRLDAELLLAAATGLDRAALAADPDLEPAASRLFGEQVRRRLRREPVAYILGTKGFRRLELEVDRRVLVPRPETELLVELALEEGARRVLDVGTGSGAIALAVADELPEAAVAATDTSPGALEVARANAARLGLAERVRFEAGTIPEGMSFDLVLANLPYVAEREWPALEPEVTQWEPREALLAGPDGLDAYRALLTPGGCLSVRIADQTTTASVGSDRRTTTVAVEVGEGQAMAVAELVRGAGLAEIEVRKDLAGVERVVVGR